METPPLLVSARPQDWWKRNWKWATALLVLVLCACVAAFILSVVLLLKSSGAYQEALVRAEASPAVIETLGTPIKEGVFLLGTVSLHNDDGEAELVFPLVGPKGKATVQMQAKKTRGKWEFQHLVVEFDDTGRTVDLTDVGEAKAQRP